MRIPNFTAEVALYQGHNNFQGAADKMLENNGESVVLVQPAGIYAYAACVAICRQKPDCWWKCLPLLIIGL
jgi:hypothetical protein